MIYTKLRSHQKLIVDFCKDKKYFGIFADYGTGKTLCALKLINDNRMYMRKILVISSKTAILSTWPQEIEKHSDFTYVHLLGSVKRKVANLALGLRQSYVAETTSHLSLKRPVIFLVNFDGIRNIFEELAMSSFDFVIVDESPKIKSPTTLRTKVIWSLARTVKRRCIMTGFPVTENVANIYSQIKFLDLGETFGNNYWAFLEKYFYRAGFKRKLKRGMDKKLFRLIRPFTIRVSNKVLDLPPQVYETKVIEASDKQRELLDELKDYFRVEFGKVQIDTQYIFTLINKSLQICDGFIQDGEGHREIIDTGKDEMLTDLIEDIDPDKNKILIWAIFKFSVRKIKKIAEKMGYNALTLTGDTEDVEKTIKLFQFSKRYNILVATQKKAAESITLTNCKYAIYYSNSWSYDLRSNSEARIRRMGSEHHKSIIYTDMMIKNSVEELVYDCLKKKKNLVNTLKKNFRTIGMRRGE